MTTELELINVDLMAMPHWAVVNSVRYALDHSSEESNTIATCDWLVGHWRLLPDHVREIVRDEVGDEDMGPFDRPDSFYVEWDRVRDLWAMED